MVATRHKYEYQSTIVELCMGLLGDQNCRSMNMKNKFVYTVWLRDLLAKVDDPDYEWPACFLIVGESQQDLDVSKDGFIGSSAVAYKKMYAKVANQLLQGKEVSIEYTTIDKLLNAEKPTDVQDKLQEISGEIQILNAKLDKRSII